MLASIKSTWVSKVTCLIISTQPPNCVISCMKSRNNRQVIKFWLFGLFSYLQIECHFHSSGSDHRFHLSDSMQLENICLPQIYKFSITFCKEFVGTLIQSKMHLHHTLSLSWLDIFKLALDVMSSHIFVNSEPSRCQIISRLTKIATCNFERLRSCFAKILVMFLNEQLHQLQKVHRVHSFRNA